MATAGGTPIVWPSWLPCPAQAPLRPDELRLLSPRPASARALQIDDLATQQIVWPPMSIAMASDMKAFIHDVLYDGGNWFASDWPTPEGGTGVRRFIGTVRWERVSGKRGPLLRASVLCEVRGDSELPIIPPPPSTWNPEDFISTFAPSPIVLSADNTVATRVRVGLKYEGGVRGTRSHSGSGHWYYELVLVSIGDGAVDTVDNQNLQYGLVDDSVAGSGVSPLPNSSSQFTSSGHNYMIGYTRFDGTVGRRVYPAAGGLIGDVGSQPDAGDVMGIAWHVGTSIELYRNGALMLAIPFAYAGAMFPYMSAGATAVNGPNTVGNGESVELVTVRERFSYMPDGVFQWG